MSSLLAHIGLLFSSTLNRYFAQAQQNPETIEIWNADTGVKYTLPAPVSSNSDFQRAKLDWSPDGTRLLTAHGDVNIIEHQTWNVIELIAPGIMVEADAKWNHDGSRIAVAGNGGGHLKILDGNSYTLLNLPLSMPSAALRACAWSPNGQYLAVGGITPNRIMIYQASDPDPANWTLLPAPAILPTGSVEALDWSPDSKYLACGNNDNPNALTIYDSTTGFTKVVSATLNTVGYVRNVKFSKNGLWLAVGYSLSSEQFKIFNVSDWTTRTFPAMPSPTKADWFGVAFSKDSSYVTFASAGGGSGGRRTYQTSDLTEVAGFSPAPVAANCYGVAYS